jgi:hypothetical protein
MLFVNELVQINEVTTSRCRFILSPPNFGSIIASRTRLELHGRLGSLTPVSIKEVVCSLLFGNSVVQYQDKYHVHLVHSFNVS